ncbi:MAG: hypothetical protein IKG32_07625, partial [Clostridia bacterium]|nr:hypothetical protein [Clostridia bacterium]
SSIYYSVSAVWFFLTSLGRFAFRACCLSITKNQLGLFVVSLYSFQGACCPVSTGARARFSRQL